MNINSLLRKIYFLINERTHQNRLKYIWKRHHSKTLIISFSGFSPKPVYNYMRTLQSVKVDQLYILDDFGIRGSYYWYEKGKDMPNRLVQSLVNQLVIRGGYERVITLGSSKGGTCAIYFGLMFGATDIYAGACQYYAGTYLNTDEHLPILKAMMGDMPTNAAVNILDRMLPDMIKQNAGTKSRVHLLYSKEEHTYDEHVKYLIEDLNNNNIAFDEQVESFKDHNEVGKYFSPWILEKINSYGQK